VLKVQTNCKKPKRENSAPPSGLIALASPIFFIFSSAPHSYLSSPLFSPPGHIDDVTQIMKISQKIQQSKKEGKVWWSFEYFPPRTDQVYF